MASLGYLLPPSVLGPHPWKSTCTSFLKVGPSPSKKNCVICFTENPLKMMIFFISSEKLFSFSRYLSFYHNLLVMQEKWLDQKVKVNSNIHDVTTQLTSSCNTHIAQYLSKQKQPDNETWSINRLQQKKYFSSKTMQKCCTQTSLVDWSFYFLSMLNVR